jgi:hypothetical protein
MGDSLRQSRNGWRAAVAVGAACAVAVVAAWFSPVRAAESVGNGGSGIGDKPCVETWAETGVDAFPFTGLTRSQGVTSDGKSWFFSWQGGLEKTDDAYTTQRINPVAWPPDVAVQPTLNPDGTNHIGGNHIGDIDYHDGLVYAPVEDGSFGPFNNPDYQRPYIALYDAQTLLYTGRKYELPLNLHKAGVPWVAVNARAREIYTAEWDMPNDRINVFNFDFTFKRFIPVYYSQPGDLHLSRLQGAKVFRGALYASRDDADKSVYKIDLHTGAVTKLFSTHFIGEMEGLAFRNTSDGASMHVIFIHDNRDYTKIKPSLHHFALTSHCGDQ